MSCHSNRRLQHPLIFAAYVSTGIMTLILLTRHLQCNRATDNIACAAVVRVLISIGNFCLCVTFFLPSLGIYVRAHTHGLASFLCTTALASNDICKQHIKASASKVAIQAVHRRYSGGILAREIVSNSDRRYAEEYGVRHGYQLASLQLQ